AFFFDLDLDLLQKILSVAGVRILHLDGRGNFHLAPAFAVNIYPTEAVIEAYALTATERNCFLEVAGDLVLRRVRKSRRWEQRQRRGEGECGAAQGGQPRGMLG